MWPFPRRGQFGSRRSSPDADRRIPAAPARSDGHRPIRSRFLGLAAHPGVGLSSEDWRQVEELLATGRSTGTGPGETIPISTGEVAAALDAFRATVHGEAFLAVGPLTDQMLDLWSVLSRRGPEVARPVETLLSALASRQMVSTAEVDSVLAEVEDAVGRASPHLG